MPGHDVVARGRQALNCRITVKDVADVVDDGKHAAFVDVLVQVGRIRGENHVTAACFDADALQPARVAADLVQGGAGRALVVAVGEGCGAATIFSVRKT